jgi:hypothetical protein
MGQIVWTIEQLMPGKTAVKVVRCECVQASRSARNRVTVTTAAGLTLADEASLEILLPIPPPVLPQTEGVETSPEQPTIEPPVPPANGRPQPPAEEQPAEAGQRDVDGELRMVVVDLGDPIKVGEKTKFSITIENDRKVSDKNIRLTILLPTGVAHERTVGPVTPRSVGTDGRTLKLQPIAELRPGEKVHFTVEVLATRAGKHKFTAHVQSLRTTEPVTVEEDLTVNVE